MRIWSAILCAALTACQQQAKPPLAPPETTFDGAQVKSAAARTAHGERLTYVLGCRGCHTKTLEGQAWDNDPKGYGILWASNLTRAIPPMSDGELRGLLTKGVHPRRQDLWLMPSELFQHLSQADLDALVAFLRTLTPIGETSPDPKPGPRAIREIQSGLAKPAAILVRERANMLPVDLGSAHALGRYITEVTCAECHGPELKGHQAEEGRTPDLIVAGGYSREEFEKLMTKGVLPNSRKFKNPLMGEVARHRFSRFTPHERDELYAYLKARAEKAN